MIFNNHSQLEGLHAFLGASNFRWTTWDEETLTKRYFGQYAQQIGTIIHEFAKELIENRIRLSKTDKKMIEFTLRKAGVPSGAYDSETILSNLLPFVNDAIGYRMSPEVILYYSANAFGTTDAISYSEKEKMLRIHDLKTGITKTHMEQLVIYAALFCLEYRIKPSDIKVELRIYQNFEVGIYEPSFEEIEKYMYLIKSRDEIIKGYFERSYSK